jgi:hypothetical protein
VKALSVRPPWWWAILHHGKDVENRDWPTGLRGRVLLHASKWWNREEIALDYIGYQKMAQRAGKSNPRPDWMRMKACGGYIVGSIEIVDCVTQSPSAWFQGKYGFMLRNPISFAEPKSCKGALGFFEPRGLSCGDAE